ncbi:MatE domain containing protein [Naviculisporaceae sp. PSN 640]
MASSSSLAIPGKKSTAGDLASSLVASFKSSSPLAQQLLAQDLAELDEYEDSDEDSRSRRCRHRSRSRDTAVSDDLHDEDGHPGPTLYRRPSGIAFGTIRPALGPGGLAEEPILTKAERNQSRDAERSLLRDNHILPPKHHKDPEGPKGLLSSIYTKLFSTKVPIKEADVESPPIGIPGETDPLLGGSRRVTGAVDEGDDGEEEEHLDEQWEAAVAAGAIKTTWRREAQTIAVYSRSLIVTFLLQYSLSIASILAVSNLGVLELGAVTLASMTANITFYAPIQGLATSLDTLCAQAYGSGHKHLVGLYLQRMVYFLWLLIIPISIVWLNAERILSSMIPADSAKLAASYLRIILLGTPGYAAFEAGKRFVQAQGLFSATTYVLLIAAPSNVAMNYLFVWKLGFGFQGAPMAVAITQTMLPFLLLLYIWKVDGSQAWGGFNRAALRNWLPMIRLALPGCIMVVAEWFAFEILTLASGRIGVKTLAAQSILVTVTSTTFQIPFPLSVAGSTRVANLIGAKLVDAAKTSAKVTIVFGVIVGLFNLTLVASLRYKIPRLLTHDEEVIELVATTLPVCAIMQLFDGMAAVSHGLLRGLGRQEFGGIANLVCYYLVALPISFGVGFGAGWGLQGLWVGVTFGLLIVSLVEYWYIWGSDWDQIVKEADGRNTTA